MNKRIKIFSIIIITSLFGWLLGYIKFPFINNIKTFWMGFIIGFMFLLFAVICLTLIKPVLTNRLIESTIFAKTTENTKYLNLIRFLLLVLLSSLIVLIILLNRERKLNSINLKILNEKLSVTKIKTDLDTFKERIPILLSIIETIDSIKNVKKEFQQTTELINRLIGISSLMQSHNYSSPLCREIGFEKGVLFHALIHLNLDSLSFAKIKSNISFSGADLSNSKLQDKDLSGLDLSYANLKNAKLDYSKFDFTNFKGANLENASLNYCSMKDCKMMSTNLSWALLNSVNLENSRIDSSDLTSTSIFNSNLKKVFITHSHLLNTILIGSDLGLTTIISSKIYNSNLAKTNLLGSNILNSDFSNVKFDSTMVNEKFIDNLFERGNKNIRFINQNYNLIKVLRDQKNLEYYLMVRNDD